MVRSDRKLYINENNPKKSKYKVSELFYNPISYIGTTLVLFTFLAECFLFGMDFLAPHSNIYLGAVTYVILPPFLILGLILIPIGALRKKKRILQGLEGSEPVLIHINPAIPAHRNALFIFLFGTTILIVMTAIGSYKAFHYTESVQFCGLTCHNIMTPEYTTYQHSPHARVKCVDCHIGSGADWYVKAKVNGLKQVLYTITDKYPRPIPAPNNLRPAAQICEQCHWPKKFYSSVEMKKKYFSADDSQAAPWNLTMMIPVGKSPDGSQGIHAHMYLDQDIYFVPEDEKHQKITWVKSVDKQGKETIFTTEDSPYKDKIPPPEKVRKMDCMDCHNRPSHRFYSPMKLIDQAMVENKINATIPEFKTKAMAALSGVYKTTPEAIAGIRSSLENYYKDKQKEYWLNNQETVKKAIDETVSLYQNNFFPEMKSRWDAYPNNIGHLESQGCFRCHEGEHHSKDNQVISRDCKICHTIVEQGQTDTIEKNTDGVAFRHPFNEDESWKDMSCTECHTGN